MGKQETLLVCCGTGCLAHGAQSVADVLSEAVKSEAGQGDALRIKISVKAKVKSTGYRLQRLLRKRPHRLAVS